MQDKLEILAKRSIGWILGIESLNAGWILCIESLNAEDLQCMTIRNDLDRPIENQRHRAIAIVFFCSVFRGSKTTMLFLLLLPQYFTISEVVRPVLL